MKKSDLEKGMIVECKNGNRYIVIKEFEVNGYIYEGVFWPYLKASPYAVSNNFRDYTDDLLTADSLGDEYNIVKIYYRDFISSDDLKLLWERKIIRLTNDERKLLEVAYNQGYKWIARDEIGNLDIFKAEPIKGNHVWIADNYWLEPFEDMFQFIKWEDEEPYSIEKLLKEN